MDPLINRMVETALAIQQIPAPTFAEWPRAGFVRQEFTREGLVDVHLDPLGKGMRLRENDILVMLGSQEALAKAEIRLLQG